MSPICFLLLLLCSIISSLVFPSYPRDQVGPAGRIQTHSEARNDSRPPSAQGSRNSYSIHDVPRSPIVIKESPFESTFDDFMHDVDFRAPLLALGHLIDSCIADILKAIEYHGEDQLVRRNRFDFEIVQGEWAMIYEVKGYSRRQMRLKDLKVATQMMYRFLYSWVDVGQIPHFQYLFRNTVRDPHDTCEGNVWFSPMVKGNLTATGGNSNQNVTTVLV